MFVVHIRQKEGFESFQLQAAQVELNLFFQPYQGNHPCYKQSILQNILQRLYKHVQGFRLLMKCHLQKAIYNLQRQY